MRISEIIEAIQRNYDLRNGYIGSERFPWDRGYHEGYVAALRSVLDLLNTADTAESPERWHPREGDVYYFLELLSVGARKRPTIFAGVWRNTETDRQRNEQNNCFRTQTSAAAYRREFCVGEK